MIVTQMYIPTFGEMQGMCNWKTYIAGTFAGNLKTEERLANLMNLLQKQVREVVYEIHMIFVAKIGSFPFVPPPPPSTLCAPQLQSTCHYIVNHYVKILHVRLGGGGCK